MKRFLPLLLLAGCISTAPTAQQTAAICAQPAAIAALQAAPNLTDRQRSDLATAQAVAVAACVTATAASAPK